jgi:hypothetical protein
MFEAPPAMPDWIEARESILLLLLLLLHFFSFFFEFNNSSASASVILPLPRQRFVRWMDGWMLQFVNGVFFEEDNHDKSSLFSFFFLKVS